MSLILKKYKNIQKETIKVENIRQKFLGSPESCQKRKRPNYLNY
jgi:hypothetical protein